MGFGTLIRPLLVIVASAAALSGRAAAQSSDPIPQPESDVAAEQARPEDSAAVDQEDVASGESEVASQEAPENAAGLASPPSASELAVPSPESVDVETPETPSVEEEARALPFRGSELYFSNTLGIGEARRNAGLTHNPYYALGFSFRPHWWFGDIFNIHSRIDVTRELTHEDDTTYAGEWQWTDLQLSAAASNFYTIPGAEIGLSADVRFAFPTSKISRGRTLNLQIAPSLSLSRAIDLGRGGVLTLGYSTRFAGNLFRSTTSETETPLIPGCRARDGGCDAFLNTGTRNARFRVSHGGSITYAPIPIVGLTLDFQHLVDFLYGLTPGDQEASFENGPDQDRRYRAIFTAEASVTPMPSFTIAAGLETYSLRQAPDSSRYNPFFNRYSTLYLDLRLSFDGLVDQIQSRGSNDE